MNSKHEELFKHSPLAPGRSIRLLALEPSRDFNSDISCRLTEPSLDEARGTYEALSYVWGSAVCDLKITCNGKPLYVTANCLLALRYLRNKAKVRLLWVDAICIDQSSNDERGHQVELMGEIYMFAENVIIWLGEPQPGVREAFQHAHNIHRLKEVVEKVIGIDNFHRLKRVVRKARILIDRGLPPAFLPLVSHSWFQRVWTFQELLMASRATVHCGDFSLPWEAFVARATPFRNFQAVPFCENVFNTNLARMLWHLEPKVANRQSPLIPVSIVNRTRYDASEPAFEGSFTWLVTLSWLWHNARQRSSSEPLDRLYGIYGLLRSIGFGLPRPDYRKTGLQVAQELTFSSIMFSRSIMPLYFLVEQRFSSVGCSWAIDWKNFDRSTSVHSWGIDPENRRTFRHDFKPTMDESRLRLEGILYGFLQPFGNPVPKMEGDRYSEPDISLRLSTFKWLQKMLNLTKTFQNCPNGQPAWEAFFIAYFKGFHIAGELRDFLGAMTRVLLECGMVSSKLPRHIKLLEDGARGGPVKKQLHTLNEDELHAYIRDNATMKNFTLKLTEAARHCSDGTLFRTSQGWIGVSMCSFQPSDLLAFLHGSSVPAILRPVGEHYQLVGFTSVEGIPDSAWPIKGDEEGLQSIVLI